MSLVKLAFSNFRRSTRKFGMLILSLAFSILVFFNFQNMIYSDAMKVLENFNKDYIDMMLQAASVVFVVFLFFFVWYASNVFLNQRKKEIGIYIFMGLDNGRIGKMYAIEAAFIGFFSLAAGLGAGIAFSRFFQMLLLHLSEISVDISFSFSLRPALITTAMFLAIYGIMILKGYRTLKNSSVLNLLSGTKQKEIRPEKKGITILRIVTGVVILAAGYGAAWKTGDLSSLNYALAAVILVIAGIYLLFSGMIPALLRMLTRNKHYLYQKERNLWVNSLAFRMKKNYRTYAMVTVLMICSVTIMATSISMKQRYEKILHFDSTYTYQVLSSHQYDGKELAAGIEQENQIVYWNEFQITAMDAKVFDSPYSDTVYGVAPCSQIREAAKKAGLPFEYELTGNQAVELEHEILMSFMDENTEGKTIQIGEDTYELTAKTKTPYLGKLQTYAAIYIVSDAAYERLKSLGQVMYFYNYRIEDPGNLDASRPFLSSLSQNESEGAFTGTNYTELEERDDSWIRVLYSLCLFMFATLVLASGSILFLKAGNEAYEDKERYQVLKNLGIPEPVLHRSVRNEICFTYYCPFVLTVVTSYFSVRALGNVMKENLFSVNLWSAGIILVLFTVICMASVHEAWKRLR